MITYNSEILGCKQTSIPELAPKNLTKKEKDRLEVKEKKKKAILSKFIVDGCLPAGVRLADQETEGICVPKNF